MPFITRRSALALGGAFAACTAAARAPAGRGRRGRDREPRPFGVRRPGPAGRLQVAALRQGRMRPRAAASCSSLRRPATTRTSRPSTRSTSTSCKGNGAAGMGAIFDTPDDRHARRARCALRARGARGALVGRQADLPVPAAARGALPRRLEADRRRCRVLAQHPEDQGPPEHPHQPAPPRGGRGGGRRCRHGAAATRRAAANCRSSWPASRSSPRPITRPTRSTRRRSTRRSARAATRSGPSNRAASSASTGSRIIGPRTCRSIVGQGNFDTIRYEYFRERQVGFEAFKSGADHVPRGFHLDQLGQGLRFSGRAGRAGQARDAFPTRRPAAPRPGG